MTLAGRTGIRIGGASGFWGDSAEAPKQLVEKGDIDYLTFDYLAEVTMSILSKARERSEDAGYALDFVSMLTPLLPRIADKKIKVVANAGGVNLDACRRALVEACREQNVSLSVGIVEGDNLMSRLDAVRATNPREMDTNEPLPENVMSMNAYLGAFPIAAALGGGADIVITGRGVDSAVILGPLIHEFGWQATDFDKLAQGSLAGHLLECGAQATGGNFTDWEDVAADWHDMGYPIAEVDAGGDFVITKPEGTGGQVTPFTVGEQMLYEIGDPSAYLLPDVTCDFCRVTMEQVGENRVSVTGAKGRRPSDRYKVSTTYRDGYKCVAMMAIAGIDAVRKAEAQRDGLLKRVRRMFDERGWGDFSAFATQFFGAEDLYGDNSRLDKAGVRELLLRMAARHPEKKALELFAREYVGTALCMATGRSGLSGGRPKVSPVVRLFSFLYPKNDVDISVSVDGREIPFELNDLGAALFLRAEPIPSPQAESDAGGDRKTVIVPLIQLAVARSGDKGNDSNVGIIARKAAYLPAIREALTAEAVQTYFEHFVEGNIERFDLPGTNALNFLLRQSLGGGGMASCRLDAQAKTYAQLLLDFPVVIDAGLLPTCRTGSRVI